MRAYIFARQFFTALFRSGKWYWGVLWLLIVVLLLGAPEWAKRFPEIAKIMSDLGIPYWAYGLIASIVVASYFAWQIASMTTPKVIPMNLTIGRPNYEGDSGTYYRVKVKNISFSECDRLMCLINNVYIGLPSSNQEGFGSYWIEFTNDFPFVLTTQNRLRYSRENKSQLERGRWRLDPGEDKNVELFQYSSGEISVLHESGDDHVGVDPPVFTFEVQLSGGASPVLFWVVVFLNGRRIIPFLAKDVADLLAFQQFCAADFVGD